MTMWRHYVGGARRGEPAPARRTRVDLVESCRSTDRHGLIQASEGGGAEGERAAASMDRMRTGQAAASSSASGSSSISVSAGIGSVGGASP